MDNLELYNKFRNVPEEAKKKINGGRLNGFTDINPMWRIKVLTEFFGPCGLGWWYRITDKRLEGSGEEIRAFVDIELFYRMNGEVSQPIPGTGGAAFLTKERNGAYTSDECYKMALTDAISVAAKAIGVGADVYYDKDRDKYTRREDNGDENTSVKSPATRDLNAEIREQAAKLVHNLGQDDEYAVCAKCGSNIYKQQKKDGSAMGVHEYVILSLKTFGKPLCKHCRKEAQTQ